MSVDEISLVVWVRIEIYESMLLSMLSYMFVGWPDYPLYFISRTVRSIVLVARMFMLYILVLTFVTII